MQHVVVQGGRSSRAGTTKGSKTHPTLAASGGFKRVLVFLLGFSWFLCVDYRSENIRLENPGPQKYGDLRLEDGRAGRIQRRRKPV